VIHSLNRWMLDTWTFDYKGRIFATPVLTLGIVEAAIDELHWVLENGARAVLIRPRPPSATGLTVVRTARVRSLLARGPTCRGSGVLPRGGHHHRGYVNLWEPPGASQSAFGRSPFRMMAEGHRDIEDTIASLVCHGRSAGSRICGSPAWRTARVAAPPHGKPRPGGAHDAQEFSGTPRAAAAQLLLQPVLEDDLRQLIELVGADRVLFGSDYPHPEGLAEPATTSNASTVSTQASSTSSCTTTRPPYWGWPPPPEHGNAAPQLGQR